MAKKKQTYKPLGQHTSMYGWIGMPPSEFAERMRLSIIRFRALKDYLKIDAIAFSGSSGCAIAFVLAAEFKIPLIYVRKDGEKSHGGSMVECNDRRAIIKEYLIVDDFVDSGNTVNHIIQSIENQIERKNAYPATPIGILCFDQYVDRDRACWTTHGTLTCFSVDEPVTAEQQETVDKFVEEGVW